MFVERCGAVESADGAEWGSIDAVIEGRIVLVMDGALAVIYLYAYLIAQLDSVLLPHGACERDG